MQNDHGEFVDPFMPRKCAATNRIITAKDHASIQINFAQIDDNGTFTGEITPIALSGYVRAKGESDGWLTLLAEKQGLVKNIFSE